MVTLQDVAGQCQLSVGKGALIFQLTLSKSVRYTYFMPIFCLDKSSFKLDSVDPDKTQLNAASDKVLRCLR